MFRYGTRSNEITRSGTKDNLQDFPVPTPPCSTYQVASLLLDAKIECIADFVAPTTSSCALNNIRVILKEFTVKMEILLEPTSNKLLDSYKDGDGDASFQLKSDSLPHAHTQATKTFYKHQDLRIKKAQELKTKTSANSDIQDLPLRYQVYQGRLLASFQDDAKCEHVGQDIKSNKPTTKTEQRSQDLNDKSNLIDLMKESHIELTSREIVGLKILSRTRKFVH
ncbi:hypothetical protein Tco_1008667 [Tanacetum coccineum]